MKTGVIFVLAGGIVGAAFASLIVPPAIAWYTSPGGLSGGVQIPEVIRYATTRLITGQLIGAVIGAVVGFVLAIAFGRRSRTPAG
jgi:gas vesicle protein